MFGLLIGFGALFLRLNRSRSASRADRPRRRKASYVPMFAHLALVFVAGIYLPPPLVAWFQNVASCSG